MQIKGKGPTKRYEFTEEEAICMVRMVGTEVLTDEARPDGLRGMEAVLVECVKQHPVPCSCDNEFCVRLRSGEFR